MSAFVEFLQIFFMLLFESDLWRYIKIVTLIAMMFDVIFVSIWFWKRKTQR